ncbi:hypothetical protein [Nostoc linckia]|uniref:hypothetical protein n=1 Tax=Nostoc linckia TaxID=92942 RepID=UPI0015D5184D|nr:hypothetical protein [Nostoc linckia]
MTEELLFCPTLVPHLPHTPYPMPHAQCPMPHALTPKNYVSSYPQSALSHLVAA